MEKMVCEYCIILNRKAFRKISFVSRDFQEGVLCVPSPTPLGSRGQKAEDKRVEEDSSSKLLLSPDSSKLPMSPDSCKLLMSPASHTHTQATAIKSASPARYGDVTSNQR